MNQTFTGKSFSCRILAMLLCVMMLFQSGVSFAQEAEAQNVPAAEASIVETVSTSNEDPEAETTAVDQSNTVSMLEEGLTPTKEPEFFSGTLVHEGADYTVTVEIGEDAQFPTDIRMRVQEILPGTPAYWLYLQAMGVVLAEDEELGEFSRLFDISFVQTVEEDGKEIILEPAAEISVQVTFHDPIVSDVENDVRAAHFDKLSPQIVEAETDSTDAAVNDDSAIDTVTFSSSTFSVYGFFQVKKVLKVLTLDGESYTYDVNVSYDNEKLSFPLDTTLVAREISESDPLYESYKEQAALALKAEADNVILAGLFDISILDKNGEKLELNDDVNVTISLEEDMTDKDVQVVHFKQDLEEVEQQTEEQNIAQNEIQTEVQNEHN